MELLALPIEDMQTSARQFLRDVQTFSNWSAQSLDSTMSSEPRALLVRTTVTSAKLMEAIKALKLENPTTLKP